MERADLILANLGTAWAHVDLPLARALCVADDPVSQIENAPLDESAQHASGDYDRDGLL